MKSDVYGNTNEYISGETLVAVGQVSPTDVESPAKCISANTMMTLRFYIKTSNKCKVTLPATTPEIQCLFF